MARMQNLYAFNWTGIISSLLRLVHYCNGMLTVTALQIIPDCRSSQNAVICILKISIAPVVLGPQALTQHILQY